MSFPHRHLPRIYVPFVDVTDAVPFCRHKRDAAGNLGPRQGLSVWHRCRPNDHSARLGSSHRVSRAR